MNTAVSDHDEALRLGQAAAHLSVSLPSSPPSSPSPPAMPDLLLALQAAGAAQFDALGWHYLEALAKRTGQQSGAAQALLQTKLAQAVADFQSRMATRNCVPAPGTAPGTAPTNTTPSPLAQLLQEMAAHRRIGADPVHAPVMREHAERPHVQQFRQQLRKISVNKQISQAMAQAPQNAGPINSHRLVLRALGLLRELAPDYLSRFMNHVDALWHLSQAQPQPKRPPTRAPQPLSTTSGMPDPRPDQTSHPQSKPP